MKKIKYGGKITTSLCSIYALNLPRTFVLNVVFITLSFCIRFSRFSLKFITLNHNIIITFDEVSMMVNNEGILLEISSGIIFFLLEI